MNPRISAIDVIGVVTALASALPQQAWLASKLAFVGHVRTALGLMLEPKWLQPKWLAATLQRLLIRRMQGASV